MNEQSLRNTKDRLLFGVEDALPCKRERESKNEVDRLKKELAQRD